MELTERKRIAADRAEQIRLGIQQVGVLYAAALEEQDWLILGYRSVGAWRTAEFGPDRFSRPRRKEIVEVLTGHGWTQRAIAEATGDSQPTIMRDQQEARDTNVSEDSTTPVPTLTLPPQTSRQQASRDREASRQSRQPQRTAEGQELWKDERIIAWVRHRIQSGRSREQILAESKKAAHGWPLDGVHLPQNGFDRIRAIIQDRTQRPQPPTGRPRDHEGKSNDRRARELRAERRHRENVTLTDVLVRMNQFSLVFEDIAMTDLDLEHQNPDDTAMLYDDLIRMATWHDRALTAVQGWITEGNVRARIAKLRDTTGRTPDEAAAFNRVADRLERRLTMRIVS